MFKKIFIICIVSAAVGCSSDRENEQSKPGSYGYDVNFLKKYTRNVIELTDSDSIRVLVSADYQGRVMTSTTSGPDGTGYGWLNYDLISSGAKRKQFNPVGGEERFWLGPEGGQYSIYFKAGDSFAIDRWQVPPLIDTVSYQIVEHNQSSVSFRIQDSLTNYSGTRFHITIDRRISLLSRQQLQSLVGHSIPQSLAAVAYETDNRLTNVGQQDWTREGGLLSIWLLGMFTPSPQTVAIIPFRYAPDARAHITTNYFGEIPEDRLLIGDSVLLFLCDGKLRSKIGISPTIAKPRAASFDFKSNVLTMIITEVHPGLPYVNSKWEMQQQPYRGDVINAYNDGPLQDGSQLGPFYELESSSPALQLKKGEQAIYRQVTCHFQGDYPTLRSLVSEVLGVDLDNIRNNFIKQ